MQRRRFKQILAPAVAALLEVPAAIKELRPTVARIAAGRLGHDPVAGSQGGTPRPADE